MRTLFASLLFLTACGEASEAPHPDGHDHADHAPADAKKKAADEATKPTEDKADKKAKKAKVMFLEPADGATVTSPVHLKFGVKGMEVRPAGELAENTGHHHIIIGPAGIPEGTVVPKDEKHIHFGKGQTEADIELEPGKHTLTMQFADGNHTSYGEVLAATITITVE